MFDDSLFVLRNLASDGEPHGQDRAAIPLGATRVCQPVDAPLSPVELTQRLVDGRTWTGSGGEGDPLPPDLGNQIAEASAQSPQPR